LDCSKIAIHREAGINVSTAKGYRTGAVRSADILSASGRSPLHPCADRIFSKELALRAQADRMSALPTAPGSVTVYARAQAAWIFILKIESPRE
jgi:hypothetical protein